MSGKPNRQRLVVVDMRRGHIIQEQRKKQQDPAHGTRPGHLTDLEATMPPSDVRVHPHQGMNGPPEKGYEKHRHPEIGIQFDAYIHAEVARLDDRFSKGKQSRPSHRTGQPIGDEVAPPPRVPRGRCLRVGGLDVNRQNARI